MGMWGSESNLHRLDPLVTPSLTADFRKDHVIPFEHLTMTQTGKCDTCRQRKVKVVAVPPDQNYLRMAIRYRVATEGVSSISGMLTCNDAVR